MSDPATHSRSTASARAQQARDLGERLADLITDPDAFVIELRAGLTSLTDSDYAQTVERVSPGADNELAVRAPLLAGIRKPLDRALRAGSGSIALYLAARLAGEDQRELRLFALPCLEHSLTDDPERTWQLLRQMGGRAGDWIEVDTLAETWARGVLEEPFRWAELEQLVYSPKPMERRLAVASTARLPRRVRPAERERLRGTSSEQAFHIVRQLIGDAEPMVQKALSWAIREWALVDREGARRLMDEETRTAAVRRDGNRAWVIRDSLSSLPEPFAEETRRRLQGIRRDNHATSTSIAAAQAAAFAPAVDAHGVVTQQGARYTRSHA